MAADCSSRYGSGGRVIRLYVMLLSIVFLILLRTNGLRGPYHYLVLDKAPARLAKEFYHSSDLTAASIVSPAATTSDGGVKGVAACLLVLDDSIRLTEWIAYHYTVMPLSSLIVALDPNNSARSAARILALQDRWRTFGVNITLWYNDSFVERDDIREWTLGLRGGGNPYAKRPSGKHDERQCQFMPKCMLSHKRDGQSWVLLPDSDEFLIYNYPHKDENVSRYDPILSWKQKRIDAERELARPIRENLPSLHNTSFFSFLDSSDFPACLRLPAVYYGINESTPEEIHKNVPEGIDSEKFMTLLYRKHQAHRPGDFSKVIIDVSRVEEVFLTRDQCNFQHNPNLKACGYNGPSTSGADYLSSIFRLQHYHGTLKAFQERIGDFRGDRMKLYQERLRHFSPFSAVGDDDIRPWTQTLVDKVGIDAAKPILTPPER